MSKARNADNSWWKTYWAWQDMRKRCNKESDKNYHRYGGRGITYDERWNNFKFFVEDIGYAPPGKVLDRKDNDGNYNKENCRWISWKESGANRSSSRNSG